jgi:hypothetical protein
MSFDDLATIPDSNIYRAAVVSGPRGKFVLNELKKAGAIRPVTTPTGRALLTPADGRRLYEEIVKAA